MSEKVAQIVIGPAGTGKTTYCETIKRYCDETKRVAHIVNLDPAATEHVYTASIDVCELITLEDVLEERRLGPNGGLVHCIEYFIDNIDWFTQKLGDYENDYLILDCPGQLELYSHLETMRTLADTLIAVGYSICTIYLLDSTYLTEPSKFVTGSLVALSSMARFECPHVNVVTKIDLLKEQCCTSSSVVARQEDDEEESDEEDEDDRADDDDGEHDDNGEDADEDDDDDDNADEDEENDEKARHEAAEEKRMLQVYRKYRPYFESDLDTVLKELDETTPPKMQALNHAIGGLLQDAGLLQFVPLDVTSSSSVGSLMQVIDRMTQFEEEERDDNLEFEQGDDNDADTFDSGNDQSE